MGAGSSLAGVADLRHTAPTEPARASQKSHGPPGRPAYASRVQVRVALPSMAYRHSPFKPKRSAPLLIAAALATNATSGTVTVEPMRGLVDEPFVVRVSDVPPGSRVHLQAALTDNDGRVWTAVAEYVADQQGRVDTSADAALQGNYQGVLPGGLSCTMLPVAKNELPAYLESLQEHPARTLPTLAGLDRYSVTVSARINRMSLQPIEVVREYQRAGVTDSEVSSGRVHGVLFEPEPHAQRGVPVVVVGGSGGGIQRADAMLLASRGHPTLAVAYFGYPGLPDGLVEIPLETFAEAAQWLKARTGAAGVVLLGGSRGSEAVQLTAAFLPDGVAAIVAITPSPLVHGSFGKGAAPGRAAWTLAGRPIPPVQSRPAAEGENMAQDFTFPEEARRPPGIASTPGFLQEWSDRHAHLLYGIPVEQIRVPVLLLGGEDDAMWPSGLGARQISDRMASHGKAHLVETHTYAGAGHLLSRPGTGSEISSFLVHPMNRMWVTVGGQPEANCRASYDVWNRIHAFLRKLRPRPTD